MAYWVVEDTRSAPRKSLRFPGRGGWLLFCTRALGGDYIVCAAGKGLAPIGDQVF